MSREGGARRVDFLQTLLAQGIVPECRRWYSTATARLTASFGQRSRGHRQRLRAIKHDLRYHSRRLFRKAMFFARFSLRPRNQVTQHKHELRPPSSQAVCVAACRAHPRVHVINAASTKDCLRKFFRTRELALRLRHEYQQSALAQKDIRIILMLIRSRCERRVGQAHQNDDRKQLNDYSFSRSTEPRRVRGLPTTRTRERQLACLYVKASHENLGLCRKLINFAATRQGARAEKRLRCHSSLYLFQSKGGLSRHRR